MAKIITCIPTGVSFGHQRYRDNVAAPTVKSWRCELTALSQVYNLYFVAYSDAIHVYQPSFPDQTLASEPDYILNPPVSAPDLGYGIDSENPHSITRILVDYLGNEEILIVACDDGDVIAYRIQEIQRALERQQASPNPDTELEECTIRLLLHQNVGASAWGLAVHREARMIAISANTHNIKVLAYALADAKDSSSDSDLSDSLGRLNEPDFRRSNHVITLCAGANVPSVSFNNSGDDPGGRWLFSSAIDGMTMLWDLHSPGLPTRVFQIGYCASVQDTTKAPREPCACPRPDKVAHASWGAAFLDLRAATETEPKIIDTLYIRERSDQKERFKDNSHVAPVPPTSTNFLSLLPTSWNVTQSISNEGIAMELSDESDDESVQEEETPATDMPNESEQGIAEAGSDEMATEHQHAEDLYTYPPPYVAPHSTGTVYGAAFEHTNQGAVVANTPEELSPTQGPDSTLQALQAEVFSLFNVAAGSGPELSSDGSESECTTEDMPMEDEVADNLEATGTLPDAGITGQANPVSSPVTGMHLGAFMFVEETDDEDDDDYHDHDDHDDHDDDDDYYSDEDDMLFMPTSLHPALGISSHSNIKPYVEIDSTPSFQDEAIASSPCLIVTKEEIFLVQQSPGASHPDPVLCIRHPLHPSSCSAYLGSADRHSFFTQVPELGIFIVASPVGRAAIFSITKPHAKRNPRRWHGLWRYCFELEYILPFDEKDDSKVTHSAARLMGVAVGPVQGMFDPQPGRDCGDKCGGPPRRRRWRLLMYYTDHTVRSYEISRNAGGTPGVDELVV